MEVDAKAYRVVYIKPYDFATKKNGYIRAGMFTATGLPGVDLHLKLSEEEGEPVTVVTVVTVSEISQEEFDMEKQLKESNEELRKQLKLFSKAWWKALWK